jgi:hypothetical protein
MKFEEALPYLREGKEISLKVGDVVYNLMLQDFNCSYYMSREMLVSEDWVVHFDIRFTGDK